MSQADDILRVLDRSFPPCTSMLLVRDADRRTFSCSIYCGHVHRFRVQGETAGDALAKAAQVLAIEEELAAGPIGHNADTREPGERVAV